LILTINVSFTQHIFCSARKHKSEAKIRLKNITDCLGCRRASMP
jgi:hypothetical protein